MAVDITDAEIKLDEAVVNDSEVAEWTKRVNRFRSDCAYQVLGAVYSEQNKAVGLGDETCLLEKSITKTEIEGELFDRHLLLNRFTDSMLSHFSTIEIDRIKLHFRERYDVSRWELLLGHVQSASERRETYEDARKSMAKALIAARFTHGLRSRTKDPAAQSRDDAVISQWARECATVEAGSFFLRIGDQTQTERLLEAAQDECVPAEACLHPKTIFARQWKQASFLFGDIGGLVGGLVFTITIAKTDDLQTSLNAGEIASSLANLAKEHADARPMTTPAGQLVYVVKSGQIARDNAGGSKATMLLLPTLPPQKPVKKSVENELTNVRQSLR